MQKGPKLCFEIKGKWDIYYSTKDHFERSMRETWISIINFSWSLWLREQGVQVSDQYRSWKGRVSDTLE